MVEKRRDTNVTIPKPALDRLSEIDRALGHNSRDQTGRYLLQKYIGRNEPLPAADRLTHVSTVMRHPLPPLPDEDPVVATRRLRLRITQSDSARARDLAFRLPGQAKARGHTDYQSRLLTDAVMTSIADECRELGLDPITDRVLAGVYPLLRQRAALGLWKLAVYATRTGTERAILREAEGAKVDREQHEARSGEPTEPRYVEDVAALLEMNDLDEGEAVWHHDHRFLLVQFLAARILSTASRHDPKRWEQALYDHNGEDWKRLCAFAVTLGPRPRGMRRRTGRPRPGAVGISFEGRGGGAVWRAQRILALPTIVDWLSTSGASTSERTLTVDPPGWQLTLPDDWNPCFIPNPPPSEWAERIAEHRVLYFDLDQELPPDAQATRSRGYMVWPTIDDDNGEPTPVVGLQTALAALLDHTGDPRKAAEILLLELRPGTPTAGHTRPDRTAGEPEDGDDVSFTNAWPPVSAEQSAGLLSTSLTAVDAPATPAPGYPGDVPPLPARSHTLRPKVTHGTRPEHDAADTLATELEWLDDWQRSNAEASYHPLLVFVPVETAQRLDFIDNAHAQRLTEEAQSRTESRMNSALREASRKCPPADHAALQKATNDPARFSKLARKLGIDFYAVSAAWRWYVTSLTDEVETEPERLHWLATHLVKVYTRELDREMEQAVRAAARQFAHLHRP
ncbi:hypothetical protein [Rhodococcus opacus]|uniref:hypothetical protein n=1 Tax=Rhodococcus opacus TaxID=37919 RepID=UPI002473418A|nr:hypothetical protein [Rhodococcus opacus]MDH6293152.1 hypothetical protein [Rhodococcus opacus]